MKTNDTFETIAGVLKNSQSVLIFPHILMDGDGLGSSVALCSALRNMGKNAYVVKEDKMPDYISFLAKDYVIDLADIDTVSWAKEPDVTMCVDCGDYGRFPLREELFKKGKTTICVDHHLSSEGICDYNYIDPKSAAAAELVYLLLKAMDAEITEEIADAIYTGIDTDTGRFQFSNTTKRTHDIASELYERGVNANKISIAVFQSETFEKISLQAKVISTMERYADGKATIAMLDQKTLKEVGALMEDSEGTIDVLRNIKGVDCAAFLKEQENGDVKVSFRSKEIVDVNAICMKHGGGGHIRAAGCTFKGMTLNEAYEIVKAEVEKALV